MERGREKYGRYIKEIANKYEIDPFYLEAIIATETMYNKNATSHKGARGLTQITKIAAEELGIPYNQKLYDPKYNIEQGARYIKFIDSVHEGKTDDPFLNREYNAASYNSGPYGIGKRIKEGTYTTTGYARKVANYYNILKSEFGEPVYNMAMPPPSQEKVAPSRGTGVLTPPPMPPGINAPIQQPVGRVSPGPFWGR